MLRTTHYPELMAHKQTISGMCRAPRVAVLSCIFALSLLATGCPQPPTACGDAECNDSIACTDDSCDSTTGTCLNVNNCLDDGLYCNGAEICDFDTGSCISSGDPCSPEQICNEEQDRCDNCSDDVPCGLGYFCDRVTGCCSPCLGILASYESSEVGDLTVHVDAEKDATLTADWPVAGGEEGVPAATDADAVLCLTWTAEQDGQVEIGHEWNSTSVEWAGNDWLCVDVYVGDQGASPDTCGIWDAMTEWIDLEPCPPVASEWTTICAYIGTVDNPDDSTLDALVFGDLESDRGTICIDNLRLCPTE